MVEIQRSLPMEQLKGLTKSVNEANDEFVIHIRDSYDQRLKSENKDYIMDLLKKLHLLAVAKHLPLYGVVYSPYS